MCVECGELEPLTLQKGESAGRGRQEAAGSIVENARPSHVTGHSEVRT